MSFLKPKPATSTSSNRAYDFINSSYAPEVATGNQSTNFLANLLGVSNDNQAGANAGWNSYKEQAGYAPALSAMQSGVTQGAAAQGLLNSGATSKALVKYGSQLDSGMFSNYLQQLAGLSGIGLQGAGLITNAGQTSSSTGQSPSTAGVIGGVLGSIFSDRRLKRNITLLDTFDDGLGLYSFRMFDDPEIRIGVMADEVEQLRPHALGPVVGGYQTVNYGAL